MKPEQILALDSAATLGMATGVLLGYRPSPTKPMPGVFQLAEEVEREMNKKKFKKVLAFLGPEEKVPPEKFAGSVSFVPTGSRAELPKGVPFNNSEETQAVATCKAALIALSVADQWPPGHVSL
jgi:hypothetical protein